ncbi:hypothetical protein Salat_2806900 [Sesamum alatum]|uniref:Uncharacterized protein n=1 Tax=Sesamum alatum TaxID=300844 RepID=A0AAE1XM87_9LAMI|nr:hypothetical protein Salat_2806900 [Sesamum alatum]
MLLFGLVYFRMVWEFLQPGWIKSFWMLLRALSLTRMNGRWTQKRNLRLLKNLGQGESGANSESSSLDLEGESRGSRGLDLFSNRVGNSDLPSFQNCDIPVKDLIVIEGEGEGNEGV